MAAKKPLVIGSDGLPRQFAAGDTLDTNLFTGSGTTGLVPNPGAILAVRFLGDDGVWHVPAGGTSTADNFMSTADPVNPEFIFDHDGTAMIHSAT